MLHHLHSALGRMPSTHPVSAPEVNIQQDTEIAWKVVGTFYKSLSQPLYCFWWRISFKCILYTTFTLDLTSFWELEMIWFVCRNAIGLQPNISKAVTSCFKIMTLNQVENVWFIFYEKEVKKIPFHFKARAGFFFLFD